MELAVDIVALVAVAATVAGLANRYGLSAPLILTATGLLLSYVPGVPHLPLEPEIVLIGILPPLLYATAIRTPWVDLAKNRRAIGFLSVGLVLVTAFAVALVVTWVLPEVNFAVALALGAVVAPPDAVAASAVARRVRMPRRVVSLLEGESLLNDATALVTLRTAIAAIAGTVGVLDAGLDFARAVGVGVVVGWVVAQVVAAIRRLVDDPVLDTSVSLVVPYIAYLIAENHHLHGSGVIAVVIAGLMLGHRSTTIQSAASRVTERVIWRTVQFLLESTVFLLIGLQIQELVQRAIDDEATPNADVLLLCAAVLVTVVVVRFAWVFPVTYLSRLVPGIARSGDRPAVRDVSLVAWAGMRGVVTLAAVLAIPEEVNGQPVEGRAALVVAAFTVVIGTLLIQGTTLPWLVRVLKVRGPDPAQDALQEALVQQRAAQAGLERLAAEKRPDDPPEVVGELESWGGRVANAAWERLGAVGAERETPGAAFHRLRVSMLGAEREVVAKTRRDGTLPHDLAARVLERIDQEEAMLLGFSAGSTTSPNPENDLIVPGEAACEHLRDTPVLVHPNTPPDACPDCLAIEDHNWVHLRMCLSCGHVGCCSSSPNQHAEAHYRSSGHPVMRSIELGEAWRWCFVDDELG